METPDSTDAAREAYAAAVERARTALDRHAAAIAGGAPAATLEPTASDLERALAMVSTAEHALTGAAAFWLDLDGDDDGDGDGGGGGDDDGRVDGLDDADPGPVPADGPVPMVAELELTMDVTDPARLLGLARELDPAAPVSSVEDALFVVTGRLGWDHLLDDQVDGVTMQGATARLTTP